MMGKRTGLLAPLSISASIIAVLCLAGSGVAQAQAGPRTGAAKTQAPAVGQPREVPLTALIVMMSDVHFDPFHDPGKVEQLAKAQEGEWNAILNSPPSPDQEEAFARLQKTCKARAVDTPHTLLESGLAAMKQRAPQAAFALVSGDLIAHDFDCRMQAVLPGKTDAEYADFVEKTVRYVVSEIRLSLTGMPVYVALGNNDTRCKDYFMDPDDAFLQATGTAMIDGLAGSPKEKKAALLSYSATGDFSVTMKAPMRRMRLIVLNDLLQSRKYKSCGEKQDTAAVDTELAWLTKQLKEARQDKQLVWVMGHIPPGIDPYSTFSRMTNVCGGSQPVVFLSSERLADVMGQYADVVRLGIFGHSHMDEMRLFGQEGVGAKGGKVAIKMVGSLTPWDGNGPSFTVAKIDPTSARMIDYEVMTASNTTGIGATWKKEYAYGETYHRADFSPGSLTSLLQDFSADPDARTAMSHAYLVNYFVGDESFLLRPLWPQYVCSMENHTVKNFAACMCPAAAK